MKVDGKTPLLRQASLTAAVSIAAVAVSAQTLAPQETGHDLVLDVSTGFYGYDNYEYIADPLGTTSLWGTDFVLSYSTETRTEAFAFDAGIRFEYGDYAEQPDLTSQWINPFAIVDYTREGTNSLFHVNLSYRERENGIELVNDFLTSNDLIVDQGTRSNARIDVDLALGRDTPTFFEAGLYYDQQRYFDTTNPNLSDEDTFGVEAELGLAIARNASLIGTASYYVRDDLEDINDDEEHSSVGVGVQGDLAPDLLFRGVLNYNWDVRTYTDGDDRVEKLTQGPTLDLLFVKDRPNGAVSLALYGELDSNGTRTTMTLGRDFELPRGQLDFTAGATLLSDGSISPVGTVHWERDYRTRALVLDYSSSVETDYDGADFLRNSLSFSFQQELTSLDGLLLDMSIYSADDVEGGDSQERQASVNVSYYRDINRDLSLVMGYRYSYYDDADPNDTVNANEIFARIDKSFSLRP